MPHSGGRVRGARQRKHWHSLNGGAEDMGADGTFILGAFVFEDPATILRIVGRGLMVTNGTIAGSDRATLAIGLVSTDALVLGTTAMPDPGSEPDYDWLWWYTLWLGAVTTADGSVIGQGERFAIESKAMRKVSPSKSLALLGQYTDISGAPPLTVLADFRFLIGE